MAGDIKVSGRVQRWLDPRVPLGATGAFGPEDVAHAVILDDENIRAAGVHQRDVAEGDGVATELACNVTVARWVHDDAATIVKGVAHGLARPLKAACTIVFRGEEIFGTIKAGIGQARGRADEVQKAADEEAAEISIARAVRRHKRGFAVIAACLPNPEQCARAAVFCEKYIGFASGPEVRQYRAADVNIGAIELAGDEEVTGRVHRNAVPDVKAA